MVGVFGVDMVAFLVGVSIGVSAGASSHLTVARRLVLYSSMCPRRRAVMALSFSGIGGLSGISTVALLISWMELSRGARNPVPQHIGHGKMAVDPSWR